MVSSPPIRSWLPVLLLPFLTASLAWPSALEAGTDTEGLAFFENKVRPALVEHCYQCHSAGAKKIGGGLKLDTREDLLKGGIDGMVLDPSHPEAGLLLKAIRYDDPERQMPPPKNGGKKLPEAVIADLTQWVAMGAPYPDTPADRKPAPRHLWSLDPVREVSPPPVKDQAWPATMVDRFILAKLEAAGLTPSARADQPTLIRRVTFDLTGLPPTPEEIDAFAGDPDPDAFAKVVDRLLASPHYGEHWGRHWLDVIRYADTAGDTADYPLPEAWRYRNQVIDSFNADKPYDQFVREQIAGDIMARTGPPERYAEQVTATGFLALSRRFGYDSENYHHLTIQDTLDTLGQSVLGLTLGCARCHDHKFDPVTLQDYYGLYGIFGSTKYSFPGSEEKQRSRSTVPLVPMPEAQSQWRQMQAGFAALDLKPAAVLRSLDEMDGDFEMQKPAAGGSNGVPVPPWLYTGKPAVTGAAQSPFRHLYPFGSFGISMAEGSGGKAVHQTFHPTLTGGAVYVNLEFRMGVSNPAARGRHRFTVGENGRVPAVGAFISGSTLSISGAGEALTLPLPKPGEWHCLQLALDLRDRTFRGSVGVPGHTVDFAPRPMATDAGNSINTVRVDADGAGTDLLPSLDFDNIGVQAEPMATVSLLPFGKAAEAPALAALTAELEALAGMDGDLEGQTNGSPPSALWHPGPNSAVRISTASQSPFQNIRPQGTLGIHLPATADGAYNGYGNRLPVKWTPQLAPKLNISFDFRCGDDARGNGTWRFHIGHTAATAAVQLEMNSTTLFRRSGDSHEQAAPLQPGQWHQVQLTLDLKARSYTGLLATTEKTTGFAGTFASAWDGSIDYLFIDSGGHVHGAKPELDTDNFQITTEALAPLEAAPVPHAGNPRFAQDQARMKALQQEIGRRKALEEKIRQDLEAKLASGPVDMAYGVSEGTPHAARIQIRGEPDKPGGEVPRGFIHALGQAELPAGAAGSGRLELATWITRPDNPLTARVMMNRLWQYHFGRGLVATSNDFGTRSEPPTHPELLDHLALQFIRSGWSLKAMHRLVLLSATWQQASATGPSTAQAEALYATFPRRRLAAEEIRDAILAVSGALDPVPGKAHPFPAPQSWAFSQHGPFYAVYEHDKRSVYLMVQRIKRHPFLALFDGADPNASTAIRRTTTVPTQALYFLNDPFVHEKAMKFAERLQAASSDEKKQIELATRLALGRLPADEEQSEAAAFLTAYREALGAAGDASQALAAYVRTLFGSNEFLHCD